MIGFYKVKNVIINFYLHKVPRKYIFFLNDKENDYLVFDFTI